MSRRVRAAAPRAARANAARRRRSRDARTTRRDARDIRPQIGGDWKRPGTDGDDRAARGGGRASRRDGARTLGGRIPPKFILASLRVSARSARRRAWLCGNDGGMAGGDGRDRGRRTDGEEEARRNRHRERASHESRTVTETHTFWHVLRGKTTRVLVVDVATSQKAPRSVAGADTTARHHGRDRRAPRRVHRVRLARRRDAPVLVVPRRHPRGRRPARRPPRRRRRARAMDDHDLGE